MIYTEWNVITGPPCSGKTAVIDMLAARGYKTASEVAREYFLSLLKIKSREDILKDPYRLQKEILEIEVRREAGINKNETVFLDRALPDSIAYFRDIGGAPDYVIEECKKQRYKNIFFLAQLPFHNDLVRYENPDDALRLGQLIYQGYQELGYEPIVIPVLPVEERVEMILKHVSIKK